MVLCCGVITARLYYTHRLFLFLLLGFCQNCPGTSELVLVCPPPALALTLLPDMVHRTNRALHPCDQPAQLPTQFTTQRRLELAVGPTQHTEKASTHVRAAEVEQCFKS